MEAGGGRDRTVKTARVMHRVPPARRLSLHTYARSIWWSAAQVPRAHAPRPQKAVLCVCRLRREHTCRGASLWLRGAPAAFVVSSAEIAAVPLYGRGGRASESHVALGGEARLVLCVSVVPAEVQTPEGAPVGARLVGAPATKRAPLAVADC